MTPGTSVCHTVLTSLGHVRARVHMLARVCVRARAQGFLPFFLLPRDVTTSRGLCLQQEWGRGLVLPTDSLPPSSQKGVNEQKPDDSGWKFTACV